jgi:hypothetical protein
MIKKIVRVENLDGYVVYEPVDLEKYKDIKGEVALSHSFILDVLRKTMGRTLTLIDATITEPKQNKSVKDIIRNIYSDQFAFSSEIAFDQVERKKLIGKIDIDEDKIPPLQSTEEILGV